MSEAGQGLVRLGRSAAHRQHTMLREMLDLFAAELSTLDQFSVDLATAPDVLDCAHVVLRSLRHSFDMKGVSFQLLLSPPGNSTWKVVGQREKLERILYNLLDNALRHAPARLDGDVAPRGRAARHSRLQSSAGARGRSRDVRTFVRPVSTRRTQQGWPGALFLPNHDSALERRRSARSTRWHVFLVSIVQARWRRTATGVQRAAG